jgi:hypothetical protein
MRTKIIKNHHQQKLAGRCMRGREPNLVSEKDLRGRLIKA